MMIRPLANPPKLIRRKPLKHGTVAPRLTSRGPMTVCVATVFNWSYGPNDVGPAVVTASDRQITAGDIEYEPAQVKICFLTPRLIILIAGSYPIHSEAILCTKRAVQESPQIDPGVIAELYASYLRDIKARFARQVYLSPLGLTQETFMAHQKEMLPEVVTKITSQLQNYQSEDTEALIVGGDDQSTYLYVVDQQSHVTLHNDVGFAAIGVGAWHAKSEIMRAGYTNTMAYAAALAMSYMAKKTAEVAPGVGRETDLYLITRIGWAPVLPKIKEKISELYSGFIVQRNKLALQAIMDLNEHLLNFKTEDTTGNGNEVERPIEPTQQYPPSTTDDQ